MPDLAAAKRDLGAFAEVIGWPLMPWQLAALGLEARVTAVVAGRQLGKSRSAAVLALHRAFARPETRVLVVSAGEEASRRLLAEVRRIAASSPLLSGSVTDEQAALVTLTNGSEVRSTPASEKAVRGWSADLLVADEAALIPDDLLTGAAFPTTAAREDARILMLSSANIAGGAFYDHVKLGEAGSEHVRAFKWVAKAAGGPDDAPWISPSAVEAARASLSSLRFSAEYLAQFAGSADALFTRAAIDRVLVDYKPERLETLRGPARLAGGMDWAQTTNHNVFTAVGRVAGTQAFAVVCSHRWPQGYPPLRAADEIAASGGHFAWVVSEGNGLGGPLSDRLFEALRNRPPAAGGGRPPGMELWDLDVLDRHREKLAEDVGRGLPEPPRPRPIQKVRLHTTAEAKAAMYSGLRMMVEEEKLFLSRTAEELVRELLLLKVDLTPSGGERIEASSGFDDAADSLCFALGPYRAGNGRWHVHLADLARRERLPVALPEGVEDLEHVTATPGLTFPRTPVWQSVGGDELTLPPGLADEQSASGFRIWDPRAERIPPPIAPINRP